MFHFAHEADPALQAVSAVKAEEGVFVIYWVSAVGANVGILRHWKRSLLAFAHELPGIAFYVLRKLLEVLGGHLKVLEYRVYLLFVVRHNEI